MLNTLLSSIWKTPRPNSEPLVAESLCAAEQEADALRSELDDLQMRFDLVLETSGEGLWDMKVPAEGSTDADNPFYWSAEFRRLIGYRDERDFPNVLASWANLLHPEDKSVTLKAFGAHLGDRSGRTPYDVTYRLRCKDGVYRWFRARGETLRAADGTPLRVAGTLVSIEEARNLERDLEVTRTRFELSREIVNDGVWDLAVIAGDPVNPKNEFWWSPQFRRLLGFVEESEFPNVVDSWASRLHPEDKDATMSAFLQHLGDKTGATPYDVEYRLRCKDGQYRWFRARGQTKRAADGTALRAVGALADIQAEKDRDEAQRQRVKYNAQLEASLKDIGEIVAAIQRIAQQTDLIALNASVEASRAGEAGRGFSVIAGEIRTLSRLTSEATVDVTKIRRNLETGRQELLKA